ncbi:MAG: MotA/TolQ/ExbB proton channel family protein [Candidatus Scalindua sp.]
MNWLYILSDQMVSIILAVAVFETALYIVLYRMTSGNTHQLCDSLRNMLRGIKDPPEQDRSRIIHDEIVALLDCAESLRKTSVEDFKRLLSNIRSQDARKIDLKSYRIDSWGNVANAIVQAFPLLGIFGTILAIGQSLQGSEGDVSVIMAAFTNAVNTTILGLVFAVIYMIVDAFFQAKAGRLKNELNKYRDVIKHYQHEAEQVK